MPEILDADDMYIDFQGILCGIKTFKTNMFNQQISIDFVVFLN